MSKKLTLYEIDTLVRQLEKTIIDPLVVAQQNTLNSIPNDPALEEASKELENMLLFEEELCIKKNIIAHKYNISDYFTIRATKKEIDKKKYQLKLEQNNFQLIPTTQDLKDLVVLNSNLELQDIIEKITKMYIN